MNLYESIPLPEPVYPNVYAELPPQPHAVTDNQTYSWVIRETFFGALAEREPYFADFTKRRSKMRPVQVNLLPYLGVYFIDETMGPDGDANATDIRFAHTTRIGFSVVIKQTDPNEAERLIDRAQSKIMNRLWRDPYITNVLNTYDPWNKVSSADNVRIESVIRGIRRHNVTAPNANNETPYAELQYDVSVFHRSYWDPEFP
jgi:hypothetical protein